MSKGYHRAMRDYSFLLLGVLVMGCSGAMDSAKEDFSKDYTCPVSRVEARVRKDVKPSTLSPFKKKEPSAKIKEDPARLAMWNKEQEDKDAQTDDGQTVVEVRGCDNTVLYSCGYASQHSSTSSPWMCMKKAYPDGVTKW